MSGGARYWNEETQRWEDADGTQASPTPVTPPPPARPAFAPEWVTEGGAPGDGGPGPDAPVAPVDGAWPPTEVSVSGPAVGEGAAWPAAQWPSGTWPPVDQSAASAPAQGMNRRLVWSVLIGAAAVGVVVSLVLTLVVGSGDDKDEQAVAASASRSSAPAEVSRSEPPPTPTEETVSPSDSAPELPAGYESYEDDEGFRIARPKGWSRSTKGSQFGIAVVNYRSSDGRRRLQVYQIAEESPEASFDLYLSDQTPKPSGFEVLSRDVLDDGEFTGSRLEYLADRIKDEPDVGTWHALDERFVAEDGNIYAIAAYGPDADGHDNELTLLTTAVEHFCPPHACDPAAID
jgi:hypothetical protein